MLSSLDSCMKTTSSLFAASSLLSLLGATAVQAEEIALSFDLPQNEPDQTNSEPAMTVLEEAVSSSGVSPLPIPAGAANPPMRSHSPGQLPGGVYHRAVATSLKAGHTAATLLPPAPPIYGPAPVRVARHKQDTEPTFTSTAPKKAKDTPSQSTRDVVALDFEFAVPELLQVAKSKSETVAPAQLPNAPLDSLFEGGSDSLVARAVGSAEGTRTPTGAITPAYYGHRDPGNGVWNMGTFSYQHGAKNATEADQKQLQRLKSQSQVLKRRASKHGLNLNLEETLNGIDLANQSPLASIGRVGYIERLVEARNMGYSGFDAIVVARTRSYINPDTQRWNAPGLGNTLESITQDQRRRANAVSKALESYTKEHPHLSWDQWALLPFESSTVAVEPAPSKDEASEEKENILFSLWTDGQEIQQDQIADTAAAPPAGHEESDTDLDLASSQSSPSQKVEGMARLLQVLRSDTGKPEAAPDEQNSDLSRRPNTSLEETEETPTWVATREKYQTAATVSVDSQLPGQPATPDNLPGADPISPSALQPAPSEESLPAMSVNNPAGAVPYTTVLSPLQEDMKPIAFPGLVDNDPAAAVAESGQSPSQSQPLPEGLLSQIKTQGSSVKEDPAAGLASVGHHLTEKIFEIDLPNSLKEK